MKNSTKEILLSRRKEMLRLQEKEIDSIKLDTLPICVFNYILKITRNLIISILPILILSNFTVHNSFVYKLFIVGVGIFAIIMGLFSLNDGKITKNTLKLSFILSVLFSLIISIIPDGFNEVFLMASSFEYIVIIVLAAGLIFGTLLISNLVILYLKHNQEEKIIKKYESNIDSIDRILQNL